MNITRLEFQALIEKYAIIRIHNRLDKEFSFK